MVGKLVSLATELYMSEDFKNAGDDIIIEIATEFNNNTKCKFRKSFHL